jgi:hypothetical protein
MVGSLYLTLGILLLMALRKPSVHRSLIVLAGWSSIAHAAVMESWSFGMPASAGFFRTFNIFLPIGIVLLALAPAKHSAEQVAAPLCKLYLRFATLLACFPRAVRVAFGR